MNPTDNQRARPVSRFLNDLNFKSLNPQRHIEKDFFQKRYSIFIGFLTAVFLLYTARLWQLQLVDGTLYRYLSENNRLHWEDIPAPRGMIFDRNGITLATNRPAYDIMIIKEDIKDKKKTLRELARLTGRSFDELAKIWNNHKTVPDFKPFCLVSDIDRDCLARVEAWRLHLPGVLVRVRAKREYKYNGIAAHLIGYVGKMSEEELQKGLYQGYLIRESVGKAGVERILEAYLHGRRGKRLVEVDALGRRLRVLDKVLPIPGRSIWLTIDIGLQKKAEDLLRGHVGAIVAVDPRSGEILAMASSPTFDQEKFVRGMSLKEWRTLSQCPLHPLLNRAINASYPPGSTLKPIVELGALQERIITEDTEIYCPGYFRLGKRRYLCWRRQGHGEMNPYEAIVQSCDVFFYQLSLWLGIDRIAKYARMFGLGEKTGIELSPEQSGLIPTAEWKIKVKGTAWQKGETLSVAIGQSFVLVTPLQMALAYAAIANGGILLRPSIIYRIEGNHPNETGEVKEKIRWKIPINPRYFRFVQKALIGVVEDPKGTAHQIQSGSITIAGKTGTAQIVSLKRGEDFKEARQETDHAWFVGYAPADDPRIVVAVIVERGGHGASVAAPLAQKLILTYLKHVR